MREIEDPAWQARVEAAMPYPYVAEHEAIEPDPNAPPVERHMRHPAISGYEWREEMP